MSKSTPTPRIVMARMTRLREQDRSFDIEFWQRHDTAARWEAARELVEHYLRQKGLSGDALRLQRTVAHLQRQRR
jgi:hypothetical protein